MAVTITCGLHSVAKNKHKGRERKLEFAAVLSSGLELYTSLIFLDWTSACLRWDNGTMDIMGEFEAAIRLLDAGGNVEAARRKIIAIRDELASYSDELEKHGKLKAINTQLINATSELVEKNLVMRPAVKPTVLHKCKGCGQMTAYIVTVKPSTLMDKKGLKECVYRCTNCTSEFTEQIARSFAQD
jgi:hypothetical protein